MLKIRAVLAIIGLMAGMVLPAHAQYGPSTPGNIFGFVYSNGSGAAPTGYLSNITGGVPLLGGALSPGDCLEWGGPTGIIDSGVSCVSGSGIVAAGTPGQIPLYTATNTVSGLSSGITPGTGVDTALGINIGSAGAFVVNGGALGTPSSGNASSLTNIPMGNATGTLAVANGGTGATALTTGDILLGSGTSAISATATGTGVVTALSVNTGSAGAFVVNGGALGTPSSGTLTHASGLPIAGISGLGTGVDTALADAPNAVGGFLPNPANIAPTGLVYQSSGANIQRLADRVFMGDAVSNTGNGVGGDWLSVLNALCTGTNCGTTGVRDGGALANIYMLNNNATDTQVLSNALTVGTQSAGETSGAASVYPLNVVAVNNATAVNSAIWGIYMEAHNLVSNSAETTGMELEVRNQGLNITNIDPFNDYTTGMTSDLQLGCGAGLTNTMVNCSAALLIFDNPKAFNSGIVFTSGSVSGSAISMPTAYGITWYSAAGVTDGYLSESAGVLNFSGHSGVTCSGTPSSSFATFGGVVTHC